MSTTDDEPQHDLPPAGADPAPLPDPQADAAAEARREARLRAGRKMLDTLVCPATQSSLDYDREAQELISRKARLAYPIRDGIPIMLVSEARRLDD